MEGTVALDLLGDASLFDNGADAMGAATPEAIANATGFAPPLSANGPYSPEVLAEQPGVAQDDVAGSEQDHALVNEVLGMQRCWEHQQMQSMPNERDTSIYRVLIRIEQRYGVQAQWLMNELRESGDLEDPELSPKILQIYAETLVYDWPTAALERAPLPAKVSAAGGDYPLRDCEGEIRAHLVGAMDEKHTHDPKDGSPLFSAREVALIAHLDPNMATELVQIKSKLGAYITTVETLDA